MAQSGYTPIQLYRTTTASAAPSAGDLAAGELAINLTDEKLYFKNASGVVKLLASNSGSLGSVTSVDVSGGTTGLTFSGGPITSSGTITMAGTLDVDNGGTGLTSYAVGDLLYASGTTTLAKLADVATGNALISGGVGVAPAWGKIGLTTHVSGTLGVGNGGTGTATTFTTGSIVFAGASGVYSQDNANLFWDDTNNLLGLGTTTPNDYAFKNLVVNAASGNTGITISAISTAIPTLAFAKGSTGTDRFDGMIQYINSSSAMTFHTNAGTERMRLNSSGDLGVGTSSPGSKVDIVAQNALRMTGFQPFQTLRDSNDSNKGFRIQTAGGATLFSNDNTGGGTYTERMRLTSGGDLGIATSTVINARLSLGSLVSNKVFALYDDGTSQYGMGIAGSQYRLFAATSANICFGNYARGTDTFTETVRIDGSGNLGIGTASPPCKLAVVNNADGEAFRVQRGGGTNLTLLRVNMNETNNTGTIEVTAAAGNPALVFATVGSERMRITDTGNVGIGTSVPDVVRLRTKGSNTAATDYAFYAENSANTDLFYARNDGAIGTGTATNSPYNRTTASAANVFVTSAGLLERSTSSLRYKTDVEDAVHGLDEVMQLRSVTYKGSNDGDTVFGGLIAEEVDAAGLSEFVAYDEQGRPDALHYGPMVSLLIKAMQQQQAIINELSGRVAELEGM